MPEYPPGDQSQARADASRALTDALRAVADANERLQFAAAWVLDAFGDSVDAETVRMLMPGRRSGRPPVPPAPVATESTPSVTGDERATGLCEFCSHTPGLHDDAGCSHPVCDCAFYVEPTP
jgi:hypothetical protein